MKKLFEKIKVPNRSYSTNTVKTLQVKRTTASKSQSLYSNDTVDNSLPELKNSSNYKTEKAHEVERELTKAEYDAMEKALEESAASQENYSAY